MTGTGTSFAAGSGHPPASRRIGVVDTPIDGGFWPIPIAAGVLPAEVIPELEVSQLTTSLIFREVLGND